MINEELIQYATQRINPRDFLEFVLPAIVENNMTTEAEVDAYQPVYQEPYFDIDISKLP
jgi:hypothetical protein